MDGEIKSVAARIYGEVKALEYKILRDAYHVGQRAIEL